MWNYDKLPDKDGVYIIKGNITLSQGDKPIHFVDAAEFLSWRADPWLPVSDTEGVFDFEVIAWSSLPSYD